MYGSDYAMWEPKWQIEGFLNWNYPDDVPYSDYPAGDEINRALARGDGFTGAFSGETEDDDLRALHEPFQRKALIARGSRSCARRCSPRARAQTRSSGLCVADLDEGRELRRCLELREQLGIAVDPGAPASVRRTGSRSQREPCSAIDRLLDRPKEPQVHPRG
jgi:hypothetical protein